MPQKDIAIVQNSRTNEEYSRYFTDKEFDNIFVDPNDFSTIQYYNFSHFSQNIDSEQSFEWGNTLSFKIVPGYGDMLRHLNLRVTLPALTPNGGTFACWTNTIGYVMFTEVELHFGSVRACTVSAESLETLYTLKGPTNDWSNSKNVLVGKFLSISDLKNNATSTTEYIVPLNLWFSQNITSSIPLHLLSDNITVKIRMRPFREVVNYDGDLPSVVNPKVQLVADLSIIKDNIKMQMRSLTQNGLRYLIDIPYTFYSQVSNFEINTVFPLKDLIFLRRNLTAESNNDWYNYSEFGTGKSNLDSIDVKVDNITYNLDSVRGRIYNTLQKYNSTNRYIYTLPFFEDTSKLTGFLPMDSIKNLSCAYNPSNSTDYTHIVIANTYNIMEINDKGQVKIIFK